MLYSIPDDEELWQQEREKGEVPEELSIRLVGELLAVCSGQKDGGLVLTPIAPNRLRTMGGPDGYMYFDVLFNGEKISALSAHLTDAIALTYVLED